MQNWSTDTDELKKDPERYVLWRLEHLVNFGLGGERLDREALKKYWNVMYLDQKKKKFLSPPMVETILSENQQKVLEAVSIKVRIY